MNIPDFFLQRYRQLNDSFLPNLFDHLTEDQLKTRVHPSVAPAAWYLWHIVRVEDVGLSRLVWHIPQLYDQDWHKKMNTGIWHYGTSMTDTEVDELASNIDLGTLKAYQEAVTERTRIELAKIKEDYLDEILTEKEVLQVVEIEGMASEEAKWVSPHYIGKTRGWCLCHFGLTHEFRHFGQLALIKKMWMDQERT